MSLLFRKGISNLAYYIRNKKLALTYGNGETPDFSTTDGILVEYTTQDMSTITEETSTLDLSDLEKKAIVSYMKMKYYELIENIGMKNYYETEFNKKVSKMLKAYNPAPRIVTHNGPTALK